MNPSAAWRLLELEPTGDRRAIKRAYAAKLKALDPDKDIGGFLTLRNALETAQHAAERISAAPRDGVPETSLPSHPAGVPGHIFSAVEQQQSQVTVDEPAAGFAPIEEATSPAADIRNDIAAMLAPHAPGLPEPERLVDAMRQLFADERMQRVEFSAETEDWLAFLLMRTVPRSDPIIPMATSHFSWLAELGKANRRQMVASVAQGALDLECIASLGEPRHNWHAAYTKLLEEAPNALSLKDKLRLKSDVADLLASLRYHNPMVERLFDPAHVTLWDEAITKGPVPQRRRKPGISWYGWLAIGWIGLTIGRLVLAAIG